MLFLAILITQCLALFSTIEAAVFGLQSPDKLVSVFTPRTAEPGWPLFFTARPNYAIAGQGMVLPSNFTWSFYQSLVINGTLTTKLISSECVGENGTVLSRCHGAVIAKPFAKGKFIVKLGYTAGGASNQTERAFYITVNSKAADARETNVTRREFRDFSLSEWNTFRESLLRLKEFGVYDLMVAVHSESMKRTYEVDRPETNISHGSPAFLPWHRLFLRIIELALQAYSNNDQISIPWWDWTIDAELKNPMSSPLWSDEYLGPSGDVYTGEVLSGPFCGRKSSECQGRWQLPHDGPFLKRQLGYNFPVLPNKDHVEDILDHDEYDQPPFNNASIGFRAALEGWRGPAHNSVHLFVGGSMIQSSSPNEPAFLLHHVFIDRIWEQWKRNNNCQLDAVACYTPSDDSESLQSGQVPGAKKTSKGWRYSGQQWSDKLWPWNVRIRDVTGPVENLGYSYDWTLAERWGYFNFW